MTNLFANDLEVLLPDGTVVDVLGQLKANTSQIVWDPLGGGDAVTFEEVLSFVDAGKGGLTTLVEGICPVPAGVSPMKAIRFSTLRFGGAPGLNAVDVADGGQLQNVNELHGSVALQGHSTGLPTWQNDPAQPGVPPVYLLMFGSGLQTLSGTEPIFNVPDGTFGVLVCDLQTTVVRGAGAGPVARVGNGSILLVFCIDGATFSDDWAEGPATAGLVYIQDGSLNTNPPTGNAFPALAGFAGTVLNAALGRVGGAGPSTLRPLPLLGPVSDGCVYFDTTLGEPIWWSMTLGFWVDATGAGPV